jgi:hypothetical protein
MPSPFCFGYFGDKVLCLCLVWPGQQSSYLCFLCSSDDRHVPLCPAMGWDGALPAFCLGLLWTSILLIHHAQLTTLFSHYLEHFVRDPGGFEKWKKSWGRDYRRRFRPGRNCCWLGRGLSAHSLSLGFLSARWVGICCLYRRKCIANKYHPDVT